MSAGRNGSLKLVQLVLVLLVSCRPAPARSEPTTRPPGARASPAPEPVEWIYRGKLTESWKDYGWAPRKLGAGPAELDLSNWGGWIIARPKLSGSYGGLVFRYRAPRSLGQFLEVRVDGDNAAFPPVAVEASHERDLPDGSTEVFVPMSALDPEGLPFDRVVIRARAKVPGAKAVAVDQIGLTKGSPAAAQAHARAARSLAMGISCDGPSHPISPLIYGIAHDEQHDAQMPPWSLAATARRWGGNTATRYNWQLDSWNTASDWYFRNVAHAGELPSWRAFLEDDLRHNVSSVLTVPTLGWVARDGRSSSFPVAVFGTQQATDPYSAGAGNGVSADGRPLSAGDPSRTSVPWTPADVTAWVNAIRVADAKRGRRSVHQYILDNEPMLWNSTHRDVHPSAVGYDELLDRTLRYGGALRKADPEAVIAGPALWGWPAYSFSAIDAQVGFRIKPDRRAHGDEPLLAWYLRKLRDHERETGEHILDVVDVHFYPQAQGVRTESGGDIDRATNARRIRSTRALWDPGYVDESWIGEPVELIPRLKRWIDANYPGRKISIGEYSFGAEEHMSGALAEAEVLGRFGEQGIYSAFYWTHPKEGTPAFWAFRAYRNYDGKGGHFLDTSVPATAGEDSSLFVSRDARGRMVAVALNFDPDRAAATRVQLQGCGAMKGQTWVYTGGVKGFTRGEPLKPGASVELVLPPYSITVIELERAP